MAGHHGSSAWWCVNSPTSAVGKGGLLWSQASDQMVLGEMGAHGLGWIGWCRSMAFGRWVEVIRFDGPDFNGWVFAPWCCSCWPVPVFELPLMARVCQHKSVGPCPVMPILCTRRFLKVYVSCTRNGAKYYIPSWVETNSLNHEISMYAR